MSGGRIAPAAAWILAFTLALIPTGCDRLGAIGRIGGPLIKSPELRPAGLDLSNLSLSGLSFQLKIKVRNPNPFSLEIKSWDYVLTINEVPVPARPMAEPLRVPGRDSMTLNIPVEVAYDQLGRIARRAVGSWTVSYDFRSTLEVGTWLGTKSVPFETAGKLRPPVEKGPEMLEELLKRWLEQMQENEEVAL